MKGLFCILLTLCLAWPALAHPSHATRGEMEWRNDVLETAIQIRLADLEEALQFRKMDGIPFEKAVRTIITDSIALKSSGGKVIPLEWVGMEQEGFHVWVYVQWKPEKSNGSYRLRNALFYAQEPRTVHVMELKGTEKKTSLSFREGKEWRELPSPSSGTRGR